MTSSEKKKNRTTKRKSNKEKSNEQDAENGGGAKRAMVGVGARALFYPTLLYNLVRNKMQPRHFRWWDQVSQFLLLGAVPFPKDVTRLKKLGVGGVITLNEPFETLVPPSLYQKHGIDHLVLPARDYVYAPSFVDINKAVKFIHNNAGCGRKTYVHCKAGRGRSTTVAVCYLVQFEKMTPLTAFELIRSIRPRVLLAPSQMEAVQAFYQHCISASSEQFMPGDVSALGSGADLDGKAASDVGKEVL